MVDSNSTRPRFILVMGATGCGKSTFSAEFACAAEFARTIDGNFIEGDTLYPPDNIATMRSGRALDDSMRLPWLEAIANAASAAGQAAEKPVTIACYAPKRRNRHLLRARLPGLVPVDLHGSPDLLRQRIETRKGQFMPATLFDSRITDREPPGPDEHAVTVDVAAPPHRILSSILPRLFPTELALSSPKG